MPGFTTYMLTPETGAPQTYKNHNMSGSKVTPYPRKKRTLRVYHSLDDVRQYPP
jgi:hypothetical protein